MERPEEPEDDPNSLENRLANIRKGLNFDYNAINLGQNQNCAIIQNSGPAEEPVLNPEPVELTTDQLIE